MLLLLLPVGHFSRFLVDVTTVKGSLRNFGRILADFWQNSGGKCTLCAAEVVIRVARKDQEASDPIPDQVGDAFGREPDNGDAVGYALDDKTSTVTSG